MYNNIDDYNDLPPFDDDIIVEPKKEYIIINGVLHIKLDTLVKNPKIIEDIKKIKNEDNSITMTYKNHSLSVIFEDVMFRCINVKKKKIPVLIVFINTNIEKFLNSLLYDISLEKYIYQSYDNGENIIYIKLYKNVNVIHNNKILENDFLINKKGLCSINIKMITKTYLGKNYINFNTDEVFIKKYDNYIPERTSIIKKYFN